MSGSDADQSRPKVAAVVRAVEQEEGSNLGPVTSRLDLHGLRSDSGEHSPPVGVHSGLLQWPDSSGSSDNGVQQFAVVHGSSGSNDNRFAGR